MVSFTASRACLLFLTRRQVDQIIDAIRLSDGEMVALKVIKRSVHPHEIESRSSSLRNRFVRIHATIVSHSSK